MNDQGPDWEQIEIDSMDDRERQRELRGLHAEVERLKRHVDSLDAHATQQRHRAERAARELDEANKRIAEAGELFALAEVADVEPDWYLAISAWRNRVRGG